MGLIAFAGTLVVAIVGIARRKGELLWVATALGLVIGLLLFFGGGSSHPEGGGEGAAAIGVLGDVVNVLCGIGLLVVASVALVAGLVIRRGPTGKGTKPHSLPKATARTSEPD